MHKKLETNTSMKKIFQNDAVWCHLKNKINKLKSDLKYREDMLNYKKN